MPMFAKMLVALITVAAPLTAVPAGDGKSGALYDTVIAQDTALFAAFNTCDLNSLAAMVSDDLHFFHDHDGLSVGRDTFVQSVKNNVCGHFTRSLEAESAEVWPVPGYGAIEKGVHRFRHADHTPDGIGTFMIVWKQTGSRWVMTQSFSYGHTEAPR
jgi:hypothetical protein